MGTIQKLTGKFVLLTSHNAVLPEEFRPLCTLLFQHYQSFQMPGFEKQEFEKMSIMDDAKKVTIAYSGDLQSVAAAYYYLDIGYEVTLYHQYVGGDTDMFVRICDALDVRGVMSPAKMKNQYQLRNARIINNILNNPELSNNIAVGSMFGTSLDTVPFQVRGGTTREYWEAYNHIIQAVDPHFKVRQPFPNYESVFATMLKHREGFEYASGCRDSDMIYIVRTDLEDDFTWTAMEYMRRLRRLINRYNAEHGTAYKRPKDVWRKIFFYDIRKSKEYERLCG